MTVSRRATLLAMLLAMAAGPWTARGDVTEVATDRFGYTGTYTKYATLADAENQTNPINTTPITVEQRDMNLFLSYNAPNFYPDASYIQTAWYFSTSQAGSGNGNPNNSNLSFLQIANDPSIGYTPLVTTASAYWSNADLTQFTLNASGTNADTANSAARFGDQDSAGLDPSVTAGTFLNYSLNATFSGLNPAVWVPSDGAYESYGDPAGIGVNGTFTALFENTNTTNPADNGYYVINLTLNTTSWAYANLPNSGPNGDTVPESLFGASAVVPEPSSFVLLAVGSLGCAGLAWRRRGASSKID